MRPKRTSRAGLVLAAACVAAGTLTWHVGAGCAGGQPARTGDGHSRVGPAEANDPRADAEATPAATRPAEAAGAVSRDAAADRRGDDPAEASVTFPPAPSAAGWVPGSAAPVLVKGEGRAAIKIGGPAIVRDGRLLRLWFNGYWGRQEIAHAESPDGLAWETYAGTSGVVERVGQEQELGTPCVIRNGRVYRMWYAYNANWDEGWSVGYAHSPDGIRWERFVLNPVLAPAPGGEDDGSIYSVCVVMRGGRHFMWYGAKKRDHWKQRIFHATSEDGLRWQRRGPVAFGVEYPGLVVSPWVIDEGSHWRMFYAHQSGDEGPVMRSATSRDGLRFVVDERIAPLPRVARATVIATDTSYELWYGDPNGEAIRYVRHRRAPADDAPDVP